MYTGAGGMDMFEEAMGEAVGLKRIWLGRKVLRILRRLKGSIRKSPYTGKYYRQMGQIKLDRYTYTQYTFKP